MQSLFILGRQPALGLAELESLYGGAVRPAGGMAAVVGIDPGEVHFEQLGGSTRLARVLKELQTTSWHDIEKYLIKVSPEYAGELPEGKLTIGISVFGNIKVSPAGIQATGLSIKKAVRKTGRSVRLVPNKEPELNTAQVLHNNLTGSNGWELLLVRDGDKTLLAQTVQVQDIESYTIRDRERPKRDARVGMLPPKLAQIIINLSTGPVTASAVVLDPFCGTGVLVQEALLDGYQVIGTDIEPRMVQYTLANVEWLSEAVPYTGQLKYVEVGDATAHTWKEADTITAVACETYLGRPFTTPPNPEVLNQTVSECNLIIRKFLKNIGTQVKAGTRLCLAVPAWQVRRGQFKHLSLLDSLEELGYNRISFEHVRSEDLLYYREDQIVARELLVLVKK